MKSALVTALRIAALALGVFASGAKADNAVFSADPASKVTLATALADAHRLAAVRGDTVVRISGNSMLPYFGDGAVLVVRASSVESLREGMVVVYRNRFGETVAHRVEARSGEGWTVRGANNTEVDSTLVTATNLVGTVYVTIYSDPSDGAEAVRLAGAFAKSTPVALAAPAR
jgi:Peptidase S24-like.